MVDRLATLLQHFSITARTFNSGPLCGVNAMEKTGSYGQLHLLRKGSAEIWHGNQLAYHLDEPSLLFYPRPLQHRFITDQDKGADFVCAHIDFEGNSANPLVHALPSNICIPLSSLPDSIPVLSLLFTEAEAQHCGRQTVLDRLFEVVLIQLLRQLMENGATQIGLLAGMADPQLRCAIVAIHERPEHSWTVDNLANKAGMSRSVFSNKFHKIVGETPANYLLRWRIGLVQKWLKIGQPLKLIAEEAGYSCESSLSRAFKSQCGLSPSEWLRRESIR